MMESPTATANACAVFSRRRLKKTRSSGSSGDSRNTNRQEETAGARESDGIIAQETPASPAPALVAPRSPAAVHLARYCSTSNAEATNCSTNGLCEAAESLERETTADSEMYVPSLAPHSIDTATTETTATLPAPAREAAEKAESTAGTAPITNAGSAAITLQVRHRWLLAVKRVLFPSQLQGWLLLLLLVQQLLLLGLMVQRQQLMQQRDETKQHAASWQMMYQQQQQRLLSSPRSRVGSKRQPVRQNQEGLTQSQEQQQKIYCRCKPCARLRQNRDFIDIGDRFKHTNRDIEVGVAALLRCLDTAANTIKETYDDSMHLPWKRKFDSRLEALHEQEA